MIIQKKFKFLIKKDCLCEESWLNSSPSNPVGIAVDYLTDNIYVANIVTPNVFVFNRETNLLFYFHTEKVRYINSYSPTSISIYNMLVYVKLHTGPLLIYDLSGNFITKIRTSNCSRSGFAIDQTHGDIYLCRNFKGEINVLSGDYPFAYQFANSIGGSKQDIKLTKDYIYVLSDRYPYLYVFDYNACRLETQFPVHILEQLHLPFGFTIDGAGNLFICNAYENGYVFIFNSKGELINKIHSSIIKPRAITIDSNGRIILVDCGLCIEILLQLNSDTFCI